MLMEVRYVLCALALAFCYATLPVTASGAGQPSEVLAPPGSEAKSGDDSTKKCAVLSNVKKDEKDQYIVVTSATAASTTGKYVMDFDAPIPKENIFEVPVGSTATVSKDGKVECTKMPEAVSSLAQLMSCTAEGRGGTGDPNKTTVLLTIITSVTRDSTKPPTTATSNTFRVPVGYNVTVVDGTAVDCTPITGYIFPEPPVPKRDEIQENRLSDAPPDVSAQEEAPLASTTRSDPTPVSPVEEKDSMKETPVSSASADIAKRPPSAEEGASVSSLLPDSGKSIPQSEKPPVRNSDGTSSVMWVRAPLLLLLAALASIALC
ncbi:hypothetical protein DQ04_14601010 [Trypanosoma grayi]|uniref:hypothetical protein n=1 Tax=Trypanosoma grayi TaxID=71804 RepID=UPI0004F47615|nr:hypothetical protein DQ04_14601010 [Trypanosoma grayi]KEG06328.1 hypothetical protein DQ04_14601010 [Trypanosoma grayi]